MNSSAEKVRHRRPPRLRRAGRKSAIRTGFSFGTWPTISARRTGASGAFRSVVMMPSTSPGKSRSRRRRGEQQALEDVAEHLSVQLPPTPTPPRKGGGGGEEQSKRIPSPLAPGEASLRLTRQRGPLVPARAGEG